MLADRAAWAGRVRRRAPGLALAGWVLLALIPDGRAASPAQEWRAQADTLFERDRLLRLSLEIPESGLESLRRNPRDYVRATLREGDQVYTNVAAHLKGSAGSFRRVDNLPGLTLHFTYVHPAGPRFHGLKKLHLNNAVQDPTRLSQIVAGQMFREAGVPAPRAVHAWLELNGRTLGLYVLLEAVNEDLLARYFKHPRGNLYGQSRKCDVTDEIECMEGDRAMTWADLAPLAAAVRESDPRRRLTALEQALDVDRFLSFMALEAMLCHWDGYTQARHNYRIYRDEDTGRLVFLPHDLDQLMLRPTSVLTPRANGLVAQAVLNTPELRARYHERVLHLSTNLFAAPRWTRRVDEAVAALRPALEACDAALAGSFASSANSFKSRIENRAVQIERQLAGWGGQPKPFQFVRDVAPLAGWQADAARSPARLERVKDSEGVQTLGITSAGAVMAGWRCQVLLEPGRYRFEGQARCAGVEAPMRRGLEGAGLTVSGYRRAGGERLRGDAPWRQIAAEFEVTATEDVELVCELRARAGEAWFREDSLRLVRLR